MNRNINSLYLDLIKKTLSFMLWEEPGIPIEKLECELPATVQDFVRNHSAFLKENSLQLAQRRDWLLQGDSEVKIEGKFWPGYAHTMIGLKRLNNLESCINNVLQNHIEGDFIEAGVWRGGACIFMRAVLASHEITNRRVFLADSFAGLPPPDESKYPPDTGDTLHKSRYLAVSLEEVKANFEKYGLLDDQVVFLKGWFKDTLPNAPVEKLAILRADGDMYESTMDILTNLYPKLSVGGFCIIDDYNAISACKQAVDDFRVGRNIRSPLKPIDWTGVFWQKNATEEQIGKPNQTTQGQRLETLNVTPKVDAPSDLQTTFGRDYQWQTTLAIQPKYFSRFDFIPQQEKIMNTFNLNHYPSIFQLPKRIEEPLSWIEHIPFAWFLITILKPRTFVELGVHTGNSYSAFCQAVKVAETNTECYGIDTWRGDKHAEFYEDTVFNKLLEYHQQEYNEYSHLLKMTFDEAQGHFADHTIDLLHIDGFHTYQAVRHDFDHWLPKLSERGVVILHDTEVKERDFGVWQLWQEISSQYPAFNFTHGYGLGIVAVGNQVPNDFLEFLNTAQQEVFYQHLFARLGRYISLSERNKKLETLAKKQGLGLTYTAQLFIDTGAGFSEPQSIVKTLKGDEQTLEFDVSEYSNIKQLRFDPLSTLMTLHLQRIILVDDQKQSHTVSDFRDNAFTRKENNLLIFDVEDPQIYIDVPNIGHLRKVIFLLDYLTVGSETLKSVLTVEREKIQQLDPYYSPTGYVVQLFLDLGNGFSEEHCLRRKITGEEQQLEFDLSGHEMVKRVRFDPLNALVIIRLHRITVEDCESQPHDVIRYETNAYAPPADDHTLVFDTEDSQIYIDLEGFSAPTKIVFSLEYVTLGSQVLDSILQLERDKFQMLEQQTQQLGQQVQQQKQSLEYLLHQPQPLLKYMAQLYLDTGAGFSERQALVQEVAGHEEAQVFEFDLSGYENLKQLRFDPLNAMTALRIEQMVVVDGQGLTHRLSYQPVNAYAQLGEILVFDTEDSQILITWPNLEKPQKVVIRLQYVAMEANTYRVILQREQEIIKQQGEQIRYLTQLVQQLRG